MRLVSHLGPDYFHERSEGNLTFLSFVKYRARAGPSMPLSGATVKRGLNMSCRSQDPEHTSTRREVVEMNR